MNDTKNEVLGTVRSNHAYVGDGTAMTRGCFERLVAGLRLAGALSESGSELRWIATAKASR